jgi:hypothetical protein
VCESELGHERQGIALVDSIAADLDAPRPKESVAGVAAIGPFRERAISEAGYSYGLRRPQVSPPCRGC